MSPFRPNSRSLRRPLGLSQPHPAARCPTSQPSLSYREAASHRDLAVTHCPVAAPLLQQAIAAFNELLQQQPTFAANFSELEFFTNADESALLISLFTQQHKSSEHLPRSVADALLPALPAAQRACACSRSIPKTRRTQPSAAWGQPSLDYAVGRIPISGQRQRILSSESLPRPRSAGGGRRAAEGSIAWDLYAGVGLFAQALAPRFKQVIAVESSPASAADLAHNLRAAPDSGATPKCVSADTLRFLKSPPAARPDLVIADPPRAGLGAEVCQRLAAIGPPQIVYVSCDPATLARDLRALQPSGYRPVAMTLVDLFPQTFHLETVVTLERT